MDDIEIQNRFLHHHVTPKAQGAINKFRNLCTNLAHELNDDLPESREKSLAMTALEEAMFWTNACLSRNGVASHDS